MPYTHQGYLLDMNNKEFSNQYIYTADYNHVLKFNIDLKKFFNGGIYFDSTGVSTKKIQPKIEVIKLQFKYFGFLSFPFILFNIVKIFFIMILDLQYFLRKKINSHKDK